MNKLSLVLLNELSERMPLIHNFPIFDRVVSIIDMLQKNNHFDKPKCLEYSDMNKYGHGSSLIVVSAI